MPYRTNAYEEPVDVRYTLMPNELREAIEEWLENHKEVDGIGAESAEMFAIVESTIFDIEKVKARVEVKNR